MHAYARSTETPEQTKARERAYLVRWMRGVVAAKETPAAQKAFMAKVHSTATHHGITLEELLAAAPEKEPEETIE